MKDRRTFLKDLAATAVASSAAPMVGRSAARDAVRWRKRRIVWNNDGSDMLQPAYAGGKWPIPLQSKEQFINSLMRFLVGTQVDSIFYCAYVNQPDWEFPSKYIEVLGPKPCQSVVEFAHQNHMEFFYSIRMNDTHAGRYPPKESYWPPFRLSHPELLLANITKEEFQQKFRPWIDKYMQIERQRWTLRLYEPQMEVELLQQSSDEHPLRDVLKRQGQASRDLWFWAAYDWALPEVRAHYLEAIEGACQRYDLDGVELDWCRHPTFFRLGQERRNIAIMNDFVHQVHSRLQSYTQQRGRPALLAMRLPDSVDLCLELGLDPETWARQGWFDVTIAGSGLMPFSVPMTDWVHLGHQYDMPVYGALDRLYPTFRMGRPKFDHRDPPIVNDVPSNYDSPAAACHRFWEAGVDGIYLYDWHTHHGPTDPRDYGAIPSVGEAKAVAKHDKLYRIDMDYARNGAISGCCLRGQVPLAFSTQSGPASARLKLEISADPKEASHAKLLTQWKSPANRARIGWLLNGAQLPDSQPFTGKRYSTHYGEGFVDDPDWSQTAVEPHLLKKGINTLEVSVATGEQSTDVAELLEARVWMGYS